MILNKKEVIQFVIEECYEKIPELMSQISVEEIYRILNKNISIVFAGSDSNTKSGLYNPTLKYIKICDCTISNLDDIKNNDNLIGVLAHECIHALFRKSMFRTRSFSSIYTIEYERLC